MHALADELESLIAQAVDECDFPLLGERGVREYAEKLATQAELVTWLDQGRLGAFVALYGNDVRPLLMTAEDSLDVDTAGDLELAEYFLSRRLASQTR